MADQFTYAKLPSDPCLTQEQITAYLDRTLSAADQHACEKHIVDCAMCEDALEGLALVKDRSVLALPLIKESVAPKESNVIPLHRPNRKKVWYAVAAIFVLVLGSTVVVKMMDSNGPNGFASNEDSKVSADSISAPSDKYSLLEREKKSDSGYYKVTISDANGTMNLRQENQLADQKALLETNEDLERDDYRKSPEETRNAEGEKVVTEESPVVFDEVKDQEIVQNEVVVGAQTKEKSELAKPEDKKTNFWNRATFDVPSGGVKTNAKTDNAGPVEQQTLVNNDAVTGNAGAGAGDDGKDKVQNGNVQAESPKVAEAVPTSPQSVVTQSPVPAYDRYNDSGVVFADVVTASDTTAVDQLEMSYINGINLLAAGQANAAITMFDKVMLDKNHPRYEDAEFQKAKALIKANKKEEAKTLLKTIETKKGKHAAEATDLLKTL